MKTSKLPPSLRTSGTTKRSKSSWLGKPKRMLINGKWLSASSGETFSTYDPATSEVICQIPAGAAADVDLAVASARRAFESGPWRQLTASERGRALWRLADLLEKHLEEFAALESLDNGKPITVARVADVPLAVDLFRYMAAWKLGPALATGCTVVLKPTEQTPLTALRLGELIQEAGIPDGVVNIVTGLGETAGASLAAHRGIDKVAFTGSTEVGKLIVRAASNDLKRVSLELGGKSPNIVMADADLEIAIPGAASAIFFNHGALYRN